MLEAFASSVPRTVPSNLALDVIKLRVNIQNTDVRGDVTQQKHGGIRYTVYGIHEALHFQAFLGW